MATSTSSCKSNTEAKLRLREGDRRGCAVEICLSNHVHLFANMRQYNERTHGALPIRARDSHICRGRNELVRPEADMPKICTAQARAVYTQRGRAFSNPVPWLNACVCGVTDIACARSWNACVFVQGVRSRSSIKLVRHDGQSQIGCRFETWKLSSTVLKARLKIFVLMLALHALDHRFPQQQHLSTTTSSSCRISPSSSTSMPRPVPSSHASYTTSSSS